MNIGIKEAVFLFLCAIVIILGSNAAIAYFLAGGIYMPTLLLAYFSLFVLPIITVLYVLYAGLSRIERGESWK